MTNLIEYKGEPLEDLLNDKVFWIGAQQGYFLHRPSVLGSAIIPHKNPGLVPIEKNYEKGYFKYNFGPLPARIIGQAYDFFRRIYTNQQTEAEVLITYNPNVENPVRLFVPAQRCTGGGVSSAFDPKHLARGWQLIGTLHSHCNFSAFHSGTDTNDASEFDGLHITIGNVLDKDPSFAAMISMNKINWNIDVDMVADRSELNAHTAPQWWDRYVLTHNDIPAIVATYDEFRPPEKYPKWQSKPLTSPSGRTYHFSSTDFDDDGWWSEYRKQHEIWQKERDEKKETVDLGKVIQKTKPLEYVSWRVRAVESVPQNDKTELENIFFAVVDRLAELDVYPVDLLNEVGIFGQDDFTINKEERDLLMKEQEELLDSLLPDERFSDPSGNTLMLLPPATQVPLKNEEENDYYGV